MVGRGEGERNGTAVDRRGRHTTAARFTALRPCITTSGTTLGFAKVPCASPARRSPIVFGTSHRSPRCRPRLQGRRLDRPSATHSANTASAPAATSRAAVRRSRAASSRASITRPTLPIAIAASIAARRSAGSRARTGPRRVARSDCFMVGPPWSLFADRGAMKRSAASVGKPVADTCGRPSISRRPLRNGAIEMAALGLDAIP